MIKMQIYVVSIYMILSVVIKSDNNDKIWKLKIKIK